MIGTFPLNVQAGSPQYTLASDITPASSTTLITISYTDPIEPITNAYYTIQNEDGSKWCTFYVESWTKSDSYIPIYTGSCTYTSSNTSDVFPTGSICWCIWCKEYYDSLITKIGESGNTVKVSQLVWDTNLVIPDGKAIESASGEVGIVGDVSVSGSLGTDGGISSGGNVTAAENLVGVNAVLNGKKFVFGENVGNASVTLPDKSSITTTYTSPDFSITDGIEGVQYIVPPINVYAYRKNGVTGYAESIFTLEAKLPDGTYTPLTSVTVTTTDTQTVSTTECITPGSTTLRYTFASNNITGGCKVSDGSLSLALTPIPVY